MGFSFRNASPIFPEISGDLVGRDPGNQTDGIVISAITKNAGNAGRRPIKICRFRRWNIENALILTGGLY